MLRFQRAAAGTTVEGFCICDDGVAFRAARLQRGHFKMRSRSHHLGAERRVLDEGVEVELFEGEMILLSLIHI
eukprot:854835-Rhodomonas_salina.3